MSINFYLSRQSGGINPSREKVINKIIKAYKKTPFNLRQKIFILTPRQNSYQVERELIEKVGQKGLLGVQITDFDGLVLKLLDSEANNIEVVDSHGRLMLMQKSLLDIKDDLKIYQASIKQPNFKNEVTEQISELKQAQVSPDLLEEKYESLEEGLLKSKIHDINLIYKTFTKNLGEDRYDEDDIRIFASALINDSNFFNNAQIFVLDQISFNFLEALFLILADKKAKSIDIALTTDQDLTVSDSSAFKVQNSSIRLFEKLSKDYGARIKINRLRLKSKDKPLDYLSNGLFSYNPKIYPGDQIQTFLYEQSDPWEEVKLVAQAILEDNLRGIPFSQIAIISNSPETYDSIVNRIFSQFKIPTFFDENHKVIDNHFIQSILSALDAVNTNFNKADVLTFIKSDFSGFDIDEAELLENYVIEAGVRNWEWKSPFKRVPYNWKLEETELSKDHVVNKIRKKFISNLNNFIKNRDSILTYSQWILFLESFLEQINAQDRLEELADDMAERGELELSLRYRQIWNILVEILQQIKGALGNEETTLTDFITVLKSGITSYSVGVIPEDDDAVIISSLDRAILPDIKCIYFLGLNEGMFPKGKGNETLLSDYDREQLSKALNLGFESIKSNNFEYNVEESKFYLLLSKASEKVGFTYHLYDMEGNQSFKSRYVDVLLDIFGEGIKKGNRPYYNLLTPDRANIILESLSSHEKFDDIRLILEEWYSQHPEIEASKRVERSFLKLDDVLNETDAFELFQSRDNMQHVSVSRLENYADCAFKHFLNYGIHPQDREAFEVRTIDTGIIIHEVFNLFLSDLIKESNHNKTTFKTKVEDLITSSNNFEAEFNKIFDEVLKLDEFKRYFHTANSRYLVEKIKTVCMVAVRMLLMQLKDSNFTPVMLEKFFREKFSDNFIIEGRIDRIDLDEENNQVRVIDYKTKGKNLKYIDLLYGRSLQLAIYLIQALNMLNSDNKDLQAEGAYYFRAVSGNFSGSDFESDEKFYEELQKKYKLSGIATYDNKSKETKGGRKGEGLNMLSSDEFNSLLKHSSKVLEGLSKDLVEGKININPMVIDNKAESCTFCSFNPICKFDANCKEFDFRDKESIKKKDFFEIVELENENE